MASVIKVSYGREGFGDRSPAIDTVLREFVDDIAGVRGATVATTSAAATAVVDATDATSAATLANDLKAKYNAAVTLINALKASLNTAAAYSAKVTKG